MPHIQIRNVPPELHRRLKSRAAERGLTLSDYLLQTVERVAERPTMEEFVARARALARHDPAESSADAVRAERDRP
jgi:plasmid stability protein